jgi:hypothetical protein
MAGLTPGESDQWLAADFKLALQDPGCPAALTISSHGITAEQVGKGCHWPTFDTALAHSRLP